MIRQDNDVFRNLFVLELANNHLGDLKRGIKIIRDHAKVAKSNNIKTAIKLQFRDIDTFIHPEFKDELGYRYIRKIQSTKLQRHEFKLLINVIRGEGCIPLATPFDEPSVDLCEEFDLPIIKIASSDINDWPLINRIIRSKRPVIVSTGGASESDLDLIVRHFEKHEIPLAINHCVSIYPSEDDELELNQIKYLNKRYNGNVIGLSSHEYTDWQTSMHISYAMGARTWERHIDIDYEGKPVSKYCSLPDQCDVWYKAFNKSKVMCGSSSDKRRDIPSKETVYLNELVRGVYANKNIKPGYRFTSESIDSDFFLAVPLRKGQISCREIIEGGMLTNELEVNQPLSIDDFKGEISDDNNIRVMVANRGI